MKFNPFRRKPAPETKASAAAVTVVLSPGQPVWSNRDYAAFADEAYRKNVIAYRCISSIAEAIGSVPWTAWSGETEITESPLLDLLDRPNPGQSGREYREAMVSFWLISGNAYQERLTIQGLPRELYNLRPDRMKIIPAASGKVAAFEYDVNGRKTRWDVDAATGQCDVWQSKLFNPLDDWYGMSPVEAGAYAVDQHNASSAWIMGLLQNGAQPSGAVIYNPKDGSSSMSDDQFHRLKAELEENHQGARNAGRPLLLEGGLDWKQMGMSPHDMAIIETKYTSARDVALAFGVPPQLLGIPGDNTYANYAEARLAFWEDTVIPLLMRMADDWNQWLAAPFDLELKPNLDEIPAIVDKRKTLWTMLDASLSLTVNEKREAMGYEPIAGGDVIAPAAQPAQPNVPDVDRKALGIIAGYTTPPLREVK